MGLGKTIQALAIASYYQEDWPLLIICPSSLRLTWASEIEKWIGLAGSTVQVITASSQRVSGLVVVVSYDLAAKMAPELTQKAFKMVIADESHYLKSGDTLRTKALTPIIKSAKRAVLITGTPALSRPMELFPQVRLT